MKTYYPLFMDIEGKPCLVVGGGAVAEQKVLSLLDCGAQVTVISPDLTPALQTLVADRFIWKPRTYVSGDVDGYLLVICATDDTLVNGQVFREAETRNIPSNVVDVPSLCRFIVPSIVRQGDLCIAVSTGGKSPTMAKEIRRSLEKQFGPEYATLLDLLGRYRPDMKERYPNDPAIRMKKWEELTESDLIDLIRDGKTEEAEKRVVACISR